MSAKDYEVMSDEEYFEDEMKRLRKDYPQLYMVMRQFDRSIIMLDHLLDVRGYEGSSDDARLETAALLTQAAIGLQSRE